MAAKTKNRTLFELNRGTTTIGVLDSDKSKLIFNAERVGPFDYFGMREAKYGPKEMGFEMPTFGELVPLVYSASRIGYNNMNRDCEVDEIIRTLENSQLVGKTICLKGKDGLFIDDNPDLELILGRLNKYRNSLSERLGSREEDGIVYSDDGIVRLLSREKLDFSKKTSYTALMGNAERVDMFEEFPGLSSQLTGWSNCPRHLNVTVPRLGIDVFNSKKVGVRDDGPGFKGFVQRYSFGILRK